LKGKETEIETKPKHEVKIQRKVAKIRGKTKARKAKTQDIELEEAPTVIAPSIAGNGGDD